MQGSRFCTNRKALADAGDSIKRFLEQGITELGDKLGPLLWQFAPTKKFDEADFEAFLALLPARADGFELSHVVEVRHDSFCSSGFIALLRRYKVPVVHALPRGLSGHLGCGRRHGLCAAADRFGHPSRRLSARGPRPVGRTPSRPGPLVERQMIWT